MLPGVINFIGATSLNNGLTAKISNSSNLHPAGTITVTYNGSVGEAFYQTEPFWASDDVNVLYPKFPLNEYRALYFLAPLIKKGKSYGYSYKWTKEKMEADEIYLPVDKNKTIDFDFIEERVRELEEERVRELEAYLHEAGFEDCTLSKEEEEALSIVKFGKKHMRMFSVTEKFNVANSHNILKSDVVFESGTTPYVTACAGNNSIVSYISYKQEMKEQGNSIMIGGKTLVITYQPRDFFSNDSHNLVLTINDEAGRNESAQLYMVAALYKTLGPKYSWGDSISKTKIKNDVVYLPINTDNEEIDYAFMSVYINAIKKQCVAAIKQEIERERSAYGKVIANQKESANTYIMDETDNNHVDFENEPLIAADPFKRYKWQGFDRSIKDFFGEDQTVLIGCYKGKKYLDWIQSHKIYNIRLGKTKGSMEANRDFFDSTSLLILYEFGKPNNLSAYKITGHQEMSKEELLKLDYPNKKPRKNYMAFSITPLEMDLTFLAEQHLIERLVELNANNAKGTPVFIEP
jgi:hypothetical protein